MIENGRETMMRLMKLGEVIQHGVATDKQLQGMAKKKRLDMIRLNAIKELVFYLVPHPTEKSFGARASGQLIR